MAAPQTINSVIYLAHSRAAEPRQLLALFAWATMRGRVLSWSVGVLLIVTELLKMFASGLIPVTLALMGAAFIWMGINAVVVLRSQPARVSLGSAQA